MEYENQEELWDKIAPEWNKYKKIPSISSSEFVASCKGNFLDLGSGSGRHLKKIDGIYFLQDFSKEMLSLAGKKAENLEISYELIHSDMKNIPKEEYFFDNALCLSALHCISGEENRKKIISELYRVLKVGGKAYVGVWNVGSKRFKRQVNKGINEKLVGWSNKGKRYYYLYTEEEIHNQFKEAGFKILSKCNSEMMINFIVEK